MTTNWQKKTARGGGSLSNQEGGLQSYDKHPGRGRGGYSSKPALGLFQSRFSRASLGGRIPLNLVRPCVIIITIWLMSIKNT